MTVERIIFVRSPPDLESEFAALQAKAEAALRRASKLPPGDTSEVIRFEALSAQIERRAIAYAAANPSSSILAETGPTLPFCLIVPGTPTTHDSRIPDTVQRWLANGSLGVAVAVPHVSGPTETLHATIGPSPPPEPWKSSSRNRRVAETERFETQVQRALTGKGPTTAINPSAVSNRVLTETLRRYVDARSGVRRIDVPVTYRDGSTAEPFPFQALTMSDGPPLDAPVLRFTLLSIRHVEMDELVDGAWFRNTRISLNRPAGLTDADAFAISIKQLARIRAMGPTVIEMFQTGLQPAVMGFYRAVTLALIQHPGSIHVIPKFFVGDGFEEGTPWQTR